MDRSISSNVDSLVIRIGNEVVPKRNQGQRQDIQRQKDKTGDGLTDLNERKKHDMHSSSTSRTNRNYHDKTRGNLRQKQPAKKATTKTARKGIGSGRVTSGRQTEDTVGGIESECHGTSLNQSSASGGEWQTDTSYGNKDLLVPDQPDNDDDYWEDDETATEFYQFGSHNMTTDIQAAEDDIHNSSAESLERFIQEHTLHIDAKTGLAAPGQEEESTPTSPSSLIPSLKTPTDHVKVLDWGAEMDSLSPDPKHSEFFEGQSAESRAVDSERPGDNTNVSVLEESIVSSDFDNSMDTSNEDRKNISFENKSKEQSINLMQKGSNTSTKDDSEKELTHLCKSEAGPLTNYDEGVVSTVDSAGGTRHHFYETEAEGRKECGTKFEEPMDAANQEAPSPELRGLYAVESTGTPNPELKHTLHPVSGDILCPKSEGALHPESESTLCPESEGALHPEGTLSPESEGTFHPESQDMPGLESDCALNSDQITTDSGQALGSESGGIHSPPLVEILSPDVKSTSYAHSEGMISLKLDEAQSPKSKAECSQKFDIELNPEPDVAASEEGSHLKSKEALYLEGEGALSRKDEGALNIKVECEDNAGGPNLEDEDEFHDAESSIGTPSAGSREASTDPSPHHTPTHMCKSDSLT